ncbi:tyrosine-type recombinase/integrase [Vibrio casei]|uniref:tyrosine-type recombinase/integrase n=1 Tax=Vibrio casei TaxID=673372 RepID=UPI00299F8976|nr:tyrosine-type recombinase/integrase [Vibrio casei]
MKLEENRDRLLNWWQGLTDEQKKSVPTTTRNSIDLRDLFADAPISYQKIRKDLKYEIDKINAELRSLGVLPDVDAYRDRLLNWWQGLTDKQKKSAPLRNGKTIDLRDLFAESPVSYGVIRRYLKKEIKQIDTELKSLDVLFDVETYRDRLLNWWQGLTGEQKKSVSTLNGNTIDLRDLFAEAPIGYGQIRQYLKEDINKIEAELKSFNVIFDVEAYRERLLDWWQGLTDEQKQSVPTTNFCTIDLRDLFAEAPIGYRLICRYLKKDINKIEAELKSFNVIPEVEAYRERLLDWWQGLTDEQKKSVSTTKSNTIDMRSLFADAPVGYGLIRRYLKEDINKIEAELKSLNVIFDAEAYRDRLLDWWQSLTDEQKKSVPTTKSNTIDLRALFADAPVGYGLIRRYLKEDINKIEAELKSLNVIFDAEAYRDRLLDWWQSLTDEQKKSVPTTKNRTIDLRFLSAEFPVSYQHVRRYLKEDIDKIDKELKVLGVLPDIEACRESLLNWWQSLTGEEKKAVSTSKNTIDLHDLFNKAPINYEALRVHLKEDIKKIDAELKVLGVLYNDDDEVIAKLMHEFISECKSNPELLWDIELSVKGKTRLKLVAEEPDSYWEKIGFVSTTYLSKKLFCRVARLQSPALLELRKVLNQLLLKHEVTFPYHEIKSSSHSVCADLNYRRVFLKWKNSLTDKEKLVLPMQGKALRLKAFSELIPIERNLAKFPLFQSEYQRFSSELLELKGIDYKTLKERTEIRKEKALEKGGSNISLFKMLRDKKLVSIEDFSSKKGHYEDVKLAFAVSSLKVTSNSSIGSYHLGCNQYCDFLESKGISPESTYKDCFDLWSLRSFKEYIGEKIKIGALSTSTANTLLSMLRITLDKLKTIRNLNFSYYPANGFEIVRNWVAYKPYSPNERNQIHEMLEKEMVLAKKKLAPYQRLDRSRANLDDPKIQARIIFEDDCKCDPVHWYSKDRTKGQNRFAAFTSSRRLSVNELYDEWGLITRKVISRELGVYILKMAQVLGMNLNSILDLELDDFQEHHPLTNKPCLTYWKERSTGEKLLHLDLFHADLQWLTISQKSFVESVFNEVIQLTSEARKYAPDELSNRLFITYYKNTSTISEVTMSLFYSELVGKYQLKDDKGEPLVLTTTRFRPTLVSELIDAEVSIREIQYLLGHASILTTINYLDTLDFDRVAQEKARKAIESIYTNSVHAIKHSSNQKQQRRFDDCEIIMKTPLGGCKNIFSPPDFIKKSSLYVKGKPCSQYNKCLSCEYVMLTEKHLPELFSMQRDYLASLESGAVVNTPYFFVVQENISLLDDILNPETSEFEEDILIQAKEDSLFIETTILDSWGG